MKEKLKAIITGRKFKEVTASGTIGSAIGCTVVGGSLWEYCQGVVNGVLACLVLMVMHRLRGIAASKDGNALATVPVAMEVEPAKAS